MSLTKDEARKFLSVLADGKLHMSVPQGTEGAVERFYKTSDGVEGSKWELVFRDVIGKISKVGFRDGDFGMQLQVEITDGDEDPVVLSLPTSSNYGEDLMKKLPNVDLEKDVRIAPYSFTDDNKKQRRGVTVEQYDAKKKENVKVQNFFYDPKTEKNTHGYPEPKMPKGKKTLSKDQWKLYFGECRQFLVEQITEIFKLDTSAADDAEMESLSDRAAKQLD